MLGDRCVSPDFATLHPGYHRLRFRCGKLVAGLGQAYRLETPPLPREHGAGRHFLSLDFWYIVYQYTRQMIFPREVQMRVGDILQKRRDTRIATVRMHETVATAAQLLRTQSIGALAVKDVCRTEGNVAVGIITERDVTRALAERGATVPVSSLISVQRRISCTTTDALEDAYQKMQENGVRHLLVIDDEILIGVIGMDDLELADAPALWLANSAAAASATL